MIIDHRLDQVLFSSRDLPGHLISAVRDELKSHQLLLSANLLIKRNADPSCSSALYVAAFSQTADVVDSPKARGDDSEEIGSIIERLRAHRLTQAGATIYSY